MGYDIRYRVEWVESDLLQITLLSEHVQIVRLGTWNLLAMVGLTRDVLARHNGVIEGGTPAGGRDIRAMQGVFGLCRPHLRSRAASLDRRRVCSCEIRHGAFVAACAARQLLTLSVRTAPLDVRTMRIYTARLAAPVGSLTQASDVGSGLESTPVANVEHRDHERLAPKRDPL